MARILLIHWTAGEAAERASRIERAGHDVACHSDQEAGGAYLRELRSDPPDAVVIDLARLPSHGRAVATFLRQQKATRHVPIVFVEGDPQKTRQTRELIPDAVYTSWRSIRGAIDKALRAPAGKPVVPDTMQGYSGTPLPKKLGIRAPAVVSLIGAPDDFESTLGALPAGVTVRKTNRGQLADVTLLFARSMAELSRRFPAATRALAERGRLWIVWPKKASGVASDLGGNEVRAFGLERDFVDFKIAAIDATWSGLCFVRRAR